MSWKGMIKRTYKINKGKVEKTVKAILDELYAEFPEIVEKWIKEKV